MSETENPKHIPQETAPADCQPEPTTTTPEEKEQAGDAESTNPEEAAEEQSVQETGDNGADKEAGKDADKAAVEKQAEDKEKADNATAVKAIEQLASEEDSVDISLTTIIGGDILATRWFKRQLFFVFVLTILSVLYISNRYAYQQEKIERKKLTHELEDRRKRAIVAECNLIEFCRRKNIESNLKDSTLRVSTEPCYYLDLSSDSVSQ